MAIGINNGILLRTPGVINMTQIAVVEDDPSVTELLQSYIHQYKKKQQAKIETVFLNSEELTGEYGSNCDIVLLDVQMSNHYGMQIAQRIHAEHPSVRLVLLGNTIQQALDGYSVDAIGFILKPFDYCDFSRCLTRAINRVSKEMFMGNKNWRS